MRPVILLSSLALLALALPARATEAKPGRTVTMTVTEDGWVPSRIEAKKGEPLTLVITRKTDRTCATEIVIKEQGINQKLPLGKAVTVTFTPSRAGVLKYSCGMDMISGTLVVQ
jgi:plastocyanin domain-containing protein